MFQLLKTVFFPQFNKVSKGYCVAIVANSVMVIKEYNGSSWETESLDAYSVIQLKTSGSIQMYLAKQMVQFIWVLNMESLVSFVS